MEPDYKIPISRFETESTRPRGHYWSGVGFLLGQLGLFRNHRLVELALALECMDFLGKRFDLCLERFDLFRGFIPLAGCRGGKHCGESDRHEGRSNVMTSSHTWVAHAARHIACQGRKLSDRLRGNQA